MKRVAAELGYDDEAYFGCLLKKGGNSRKHSLADSTAYTLQVTGATVVGAYEVP